MRKLVLITAAGLAAEVLLQYVIHFGSANLRGALPGVVSLGATVATYGIFAVVGWLIGGQYRLLYAALAGGVIGLLSNLIAGLYLLPSIIQSTKARLEEPVPEFLWVVPLVLSSLVMSVIAAAVAWVGGKVAQTRRDRMRSAA